MKPNPSAVPCQPELDPACPVSTKSNTPRGFTLIELLVVIAIIAILAAMLLPALAKSKQQAHATICRSNLKEQSLATFMYADDNFDQLPFPWWYNASNDDANKNNYQTLIVSYIKRSSFAAGSTTANSDFAQNVFKCPTRMLENHWRQFKNYPNQANPWKISYAMNQFVLLSFPANVTSPKTAKLSTIQRPTETFMIADVSKDLNHPAITILGRQPDGFYDVGYKHGSAQPQGKANLASMDSHVSSFNNRQTNNIVMEFKGK